MNRSAAIHIIDPTPSMIQFTEDATAHIQKWIESTNRNNPKKATTTFKGTYQGNGYNVSATVRANYGKEPGANINAMPRGGNAVAAWIEVIAPEDYEAFSPAVKHSHDVYLEQGLLHEVVHSVDPDIIALGRSRFERMVGKLQLATALPIYFINPYLPILTSGITIAYVLFKRLKANAKYIHPSTSLEGYLNQKVERTAIISSVTQVIRSWIRNNQIDRETLELVDPHDLVRYMEGHIPRQLLAIINKDPEDRKALDDFLLKMALEFIQVP